MTNIERHLIAFAIIFGAAFLLNHSMYKEKPPVTEPLHSPNTNSSGSSSALQMIISM